MACSKSTRRGHGRRRSKGGSQKQMLMTVAAGAAAAYAARTVATDNETLNKHNYSRPLVMALAGYYARKKGMHAIGDGLLGAAGATAAYEYHDREVINEKNGKTSDTATGKPTSPEMGASPAPVTQTAGFYDAGALAYPYGYAPDAGAYAPRVVDVPVPDFNASGIYDAASADEDEDDDRDAGAVVYGRRERTGPSVNFSGF